MEMAMTGDGVTPLAFFKALADESRLRIVGFLAARERSVQELAELLKLKEPTVSHHLAILRGIHLVVARADGTTRWHALDPQALRQMSRTLLDDKNVAALAGPKAKPDERILSAFLDDDGHLKSIPASHKKRAVILRWLVAQFEEDRRYRESEINETIQRRHWDSATLRRELIGHRMMRRDKGIYWRTPRAEWREIDASGRH
jgi:DNA-binding transcriptional ArsR family regulator